MSHLLAAVALALTLIFSTIGCSSSNRSGGDDKKDKTANSPIRVTVIDDPPIAEQIKLHWSARSTGKLQVDVLTSEEALHRDVLETDIVIFPSKMLGEVVERQWIQKLPAALSAANEYALDDTFRLQRQKESRWGVEQYGVPFGSPQFMLYARQDLLSEAKTEELDTWAQYQAAVTSGKLSSEDPKRFATAEPLGAGWAGSVLLSRAAAYAKNRGFYSDLFDFDTMKPLIDGEPFVRALGELVEAYQHMPPESIDADPATVKRWFYEGRVAIAWGWPQKSFDISQLEHRIDSLDSIKLFPLPGSTEVYNLGESRWDQRDRSERIHVPLIAMRGRIGAVARRAKSPKAAASTLAWLSGNAMGGTIASSSPDTTCFRASQTDGSIWADTGMPTTVADEYCAQVAHTQDSSQALSALRLPAQPEYQQALDEAVRSAVKDGVPPKEALATAAAAWEAITNRQDRAKQKAAYLRSLGLEP